MPLENVYHAELNATRDLILEAHGIKMDLYTSYENFPALSGVAEDESGDEFLAVFESRSDLVLNGGDKALITTLVIIWQKKFPNLDSETFLLQDYKHVTVAWEHGT